jgi:hypothetical protein
MTLSPQGTAAIKQAVQQHIARNNARRTERQIQEHFGPRVVSLEVRRFNSGRKVTV